MKLISNVTILRTIIIIALFFHGTLLMAQTSAFDSFYQKIEKDKFQHKHEKVLKEINKVIKQNPNNFSAYQIELLKVLKVETLADATLIQQGLELSNEILSNNLINDEYKTKLYIERALLFEFIENFKKSNEALNQAKNLINKDTELKKKYYAKWLIRKSSWYRMQEIHEESYKLALKAKEFADEHNDFSKSSEAGILLSFYYSKKDNLEQAITYNNIAITTGKKLNNTISVIYLYINQSKIYKKLNKESIAIQYIDSAYQLSKSSSYADAKSVSFMTKSQVFEAQKKLDSALFYYKNAIAFEKEYEENLNVIKINEQNLNFDIQKEKKEKQALVIKNEKLNKTIAFISISLCILAAFIFYENKRKKQLQAQKKKIEKDAVILEELVANKTYLIQELNHRVKNNLATILSLIEIQKEEKNNNIQQLHDRVNTIAIGHNLFTYNETGKNTKINVKEYVESIFTNKNLASTRKVTYKLQIEQIELNLETALPIGLLLNELITNSIKHAILNENDTLHLTFSIFLRNDILEMSYKDNGTFFSNKVKPNSMGIFIIEGMLNQIHATYSRKKSTYFIKIPYAKTS